MPIVSRKSLRRSLALTWMHDGLVSTVTGSVGQTASLSHVIDVTQANPDFAGQALYQRSWFKVNGMELRVGSFNVGSGAYVTGQLAATTIASGNEYERHDVLSPSDKDRAVDDAIGRVRVNREVGIPSVDGLTAYPLDGAASPNLVETVLDCYVFTNPSGSLDRGKAALDSWQVVSTATGTELRVSPAMGASMQIVLDAILALSLGAADTATINIPDERWVLAGAAAKAWDLVLQRAPGQNRGQYEQNRNEAARLYSRLSPRFQPQIDRAITLDDPF